MRFHIENMTCGGCATSVTKAVAAIDPEAIVDADPVTKKVSIESTMPADAISQALDAAGYPATTL